MNNKMEFQKISNKKADLFIFENKKIGFDVKRIYFTKNVPVGEIRGHHAHKTLRQILLCPHGAIRVTLDDGLGGRESTVLDVPEKGLYVGPAMWRTMEWLKSDSLLLVFASQNYEAADYIRKYDEFLAFAREPEKTTGDGVL